MSKSDAPALLQVPDLTAPARPRKISHSERTLSSGLRVLAVRRPSVPMVEVRLRVPFLSARPTHLAQSSLLSDALLTGTSNASRLELAAELQGLGGDISVGLDADRLLLSASALSSKLGGLLDVFADVVTAASYPSDEVSGERERLIERVTIARSQPGVIANEALSQRIAPGHPYGRSVPNTGEVGAVTAAQLRKLHARMVVPSGASLVIVGNVTPAKALDLAEKALLGWQGSPDAGKSPSLPDVPAQPLLLVNRPGSVQTSLRLAGTAVGRDDERYPALQLANLAFGGYFSSRWVENIREDKGYTYSPRSSLDHAVLGSTFHASADVATEVTAPAMVETLYELGRISSLPITTAELESVSQYAIGTLALSTATQAGLASTLSALVGAGLPVEWLGEHRARLAGTTIDEVAAAAAQFLAPARLVGVAVGDADAVAGPLSGVVDLEVTEVESSGD